MCRDDEHNGALQHHDQASLHVGVLVILLAVPLDGHVLASSLLFDWQWPRAARR